MAVFMSVCACVHEIPQLSVLTELSSSAHTYRPDLGFQTPFSTKRSKWLIPGLKQGKYEMSLELLPVAKGKEVPQRNGHM